jgi:hypothetical protein
MKAMADEPSARHEWAGPSMGPAHSVTIAHEHFGLLRGFVR